MAFFSIVPPKSAPRTSGTTTYYLFTCAFDVSNTWDIAINTCLTAVVAVVLQTEGGLHHEDDMSPVISTLVGLGEPGFASFAER